MITPALSVLSAVEGLEVVAPSLDAVRAAAVDRHPARALSRPVARHRGGLGVLRADHRRLVRGDRRPRPRPHRRQSARAARAQPDLRRSASSSPMGSSASSPSARSSSPSPAPRRSTPTSAISAGSRSRRPGSGSSSRRWSLNYFGQGALVLAQPGDASRIRSS